MRIKIDIDNLMGNVKVPLSKSDIHRKLIAGAIKSKEEYYRLKNEIPEGSWSDDVRATAGCIEEIFYGTADVATAYAGESGSTLRFLIPVSAALGRKTDFILDEGLRKRPVKGLLDVLNDHGGDVYADGEKIKVRGKLEPGVYEIDASVSSQYVSGLYFAKKILGDSMTVVEKGLKVSGPYIEMTKKVLNQSEGYLSFEGDWSAGAYYHGLDFMGCSIDIAGLACDSAQGDKAITDILQGLGESEVDITDVPDLAPVVAMCAASLDEGYEVCMKGAGRLSLKETDRGNGIADIINDLGGEAVFCGDTLTVKGKGRLNGGCCSGRNDHRLIMMAACLSRICEKEVEIKDAAGVSKSYPEFFDDIAVLGASVEYISEE